MAAATALAAAAAAAVVVVVMVVVMMVVVVVVPAAVVGAVSANHLWRSGAAVLVGFCCCQHHLCCDCHLTGTVMLYMLLSCARGVCTMRWRCCHLRGAAAGGITTVLLLAGEAAGVSHGHAANAGASHEACAHANCAAEPVDTLLWAEVLNCRFLSCKALSYRSHLVTYAAACFL
jgi:hypothetical protein